MCSRVCVKFCCIERKKFRAIEVWEIYWWKKSMRLKTKAIIRTRKKTQKINDRRIGLMRWIYIQNKLEILSSFCKQNWLINGTVRICKIVYTCISLLLMTNTNFRAVSCTRYTRVCVCVCDNMKYFHNTFGHCFHLQMVSI